MSMARLRSIRFCTEVELCEFVNNNAITVIEQIVFDPYGYVLFYR